MSWRRPRDEEHKPPSLHADVSDSGQANQLNSGIQNIYNQPFVLVTGSGVPLIGSQSPHGLLEQLPTAARAGFVGRVAELRKAWSYVSAGHVISIVGLEHMGKSAFIDRLMADAEFRRALPSERPWALMRISVPGSASRFPVSRALASRLKADLFTFDDYGDGTATTEQKIQYTLHDLLPSVVGGHDLVVVIDCGRCGEVTTELEADLDEFVANPVFERSVVLVASESELHVDGKQQRHGMPPVKLTPLAEAEAAELLTAELAKNKINTNALEAVRQANDSITRRPRIILLGAEVYHRLEADNEEKANADPEAVALALLEACQLTVTTALAKVGCRLVDDGGSPGTLAPMMVWALSPDIALSGAVLTRLGFDLGSLTALVDQGVLVEHEVTGSDASYYRLSAATSVALRNLVLLPLRSGSPHRLKGVESVALGSAASDVDVLDSVLSDVACDFFEIALSTVVDDESDDAHRSILYAIESAVGWLRSSAPSSLPQLDTKLTHLANSLDTEAITTPVEPRPSPDLGPALEVRDAPPSARRHLLYQAVSQLSVKMREPVTAEAVADFLVAGREAATALRNVAPGIPTQMLRSIDNALYFGVRRFQSGDAVLVIRAGLVDLLYEDAVHSDEGKISRIAWTSSWLINTANLQLDAQQQEQASTTVEMVFALLDELPEPHTPGGLASWLWLQARAMKARVRTTTDEEVRLETLRSVMDLCRTGLQRCAATPALRGLWAGRFLDAARFYALELRSDEDRASTVHTAIDVLMDHYGPVPEWELVTCLKVSKFQRAVYRAQADPALLLDGTRAVLELLNQHHELILARARAGDVQPLLELATATRFNADALLENERRREAVTVAVAAARLAETAVEHGPSADSFQTWLICLQLCERCEATVGTTEHRAAIKRRNAVLRAVTWLKTQQSRSPAHAKLARLCIEEEWRRHGADLRSAALQASGGRSEPDPDQLHKVYMKRVRVLEGHERRYGPTINTLLLRANLERDYRYILALSARTAGSRNRPVDNTITWEVLDRAAALWPFSNRIRSARARLHRHLWNYSAAVEGFEGVIHSSRSGYWRRLAQIDAAEALLTSVRHEVMPVEERGAALERATGYLSESLAHKFQSQKVVVLRERIALEAKAPVDWVRIDSCFDELIGSNYATSIGLYLHRRRQEQTAPGDDNTPDDDAGSETKLELAKLLYEDFTDTELVSGVGELYLRHSQLLCALTRSNAVAVADAGDAETREHALRSARRAYDCFDANRVLLEARFDDEHGVNRFLRAEAIRYAAWLAGTVNPFDWSPESKPSWLKLALDLYQSALSRSVGAFRALCADRITAAQKLLNQLANNDTDAV